MNIKIACCILVYIIVNVVHSKSILKKHAHKQALKSSKEPKKRISTQQKVGSGHAKGPMANNIQGSVPLPVIMPFPMIPFDDRYPILLAPNGKPKKGREKKKDPKGETEDETDKDVDDENDKGGKEYKAMGPGKVEPGSGKRLKKVAERERNEDDDDEGNEDEEDDKNQNEKGEESQKRLKDVFLGNRKGDESSEDDENNQDVNNEEDEVSQQNGKDAFNEEDTTKDNEEEEGDDEEASNEEETEKEDKKSYDNEDKDDVSGTEPQKARNKRAIFKPIIGHPEDIMPYIMLGGEEQDVVDVKNVHKVATRNTDEEYNPSQQADTETRNARIRSVEEEGEEKGHLINTRDVDDEEYATHALNTRAVNAEEEDEEELHDMRPRSLPDESPDLDTAEKKLKDTQLAADVLTQIQKALGANPESAVQETHSLADFLRKNMESYDEEIAKDILATQNAQTRSKVLVNEESAELTSAKRKLQNDRKKEQEIQQELKELKDIELMTTELELAKYLATENARHQVNFARAIVNSRPPPPPPPPPSTLAPTPIEYAPITYQQPAYSYMPAPALEVPRQPAVMAMPWRQYPQPINYAFNPNQAMSGRIRNDMDVFGGGKASIVYNEPSYESMKVHQAALAHPSGFQQAIETPRPSYAVHTKAQSRHMTRPTISKPKKFKETRPFSTRFYPRPRPYSQSRVSSSHREQQASSLISGKPTLSFPGPTYTPPPLWTRAGNPQGRYTLYSSKYAKQQQQQKAKRPSNKALKSFFTQQQRPPSYFSNMYQNPAFLAHQHGPLFTEEAYKVPMAPPMHYQVGEYHSVEKEQPHFDIHAPFTSQILGTQEYHLPNTYQHELLPSRPQTHLASTQRQLTDYAQPRNGFGSQFAIPRQQAAPFVPPPQVIYQTPASFAETVGSSKGGIPFYSSYYAAPQPVSHVQQQYTGYQQVGQPFETMNTDSESFNPPASAPPQEKAPIKAKENEDEKVPLGYGLYPLPENAEGKMDDKEEKTLNDHIKDDTEKLSETKQAAMAVTKIENKVGFDPGSIAKLVDFVKQAAQRDVSLSERAMKRDQMTIKRMEIERVKSKKSGISNESNIAATEAQKKLKIDSDLLREAKDRLEKIRKMELIVTSIEAAKYSALSRKQAKLENDVKIMNNYKATKKTVVGRKGFGKRAS